MRRGYQRIQLPKDCGLTLLVPVGTVSEITWMKELIDLQYITIIRNEDNRNFFKPTKAVLATSTSSIIIADNLQRTNHITWRIILVLPWIKDLGGQSKCIR